MTVRKCNLKKNKTWISERFQMYLCHVCKGEVGRRISLVLLDNFKKFFLPLQCHFKLRVVPSIVVQGEGQEESFGVGKVLICLKQKEKRTLKESSFFFVYQTVISDRIVIHSLWYPPTARNGKTGAP